MNYIWIDLLVLFQSISTVLAQEVTTVDGYPVIDLSAFSPLGATLSKPEADARLAEMKAQTVSNSAYVSPAGSSASYLDGTWNIRMSFKFQVMRSDLGMTMDWASAWSGCIGYNGSNDGGGSGTWRLPTQRELQMIWILHPQLIGKGEFMFNYNYWSSTEYDASNVWFVVFNNGFVTTGSKANSNYVRCVRDLP